METRTDYTGIAGAGIGAGHLPARREWDLKMAVARHMFEDAEQATVLLNRILELRVTEGQALKAPDALLSLFMDEVLRARTDAEYVIGVYEVVLPALLEALTAHQRDTQQLVDYPTVRALGFIRSEMDGQITLGGALVKRFVGADQRREADEYAGNLRAMLHRIGGFDGTGASQPQEVRRWRSGEPYTLPAKSARPTDFGPSLHYRVPGCIDEKLSDAENALREMMKIRQEEMTAAELIAGVMFETTDMPWEFFRTLARHCWDEARHSAFGQAALEKHGIDWADEIQHAKFGRNWGTAFFDQDFEKSRIFGEEAWMELLRYRASLEPDREKYHTMFYLERFGKTPATKTTEIALALADGG